MQVECRLKFTVDNNTVYYEFINCPEEKETFKIII